MRQLFFFLAFVFSLSAFGRDIHPFHVGSAEFRYSPKSKTVQVTARLFMDDLERAVREKYQVNVAFLRPADRASMEKLLIQYCNEYLKLKVDGQMMRLNFIGYEEDKEGVNLYLESPVLPKTPAKVEMGVSLLYNIFDDQINLVHIIIGNQRVSKKLDYPNRYFSWPK